MIFDLYRAITFEKTIVNVKLDRPNLINLLIN